MASESIRSWPDLEKKFHALKRMSVERELEIVGQELLRLRQIQYESAICYVRHSVDRGDMELFEANEKVGQLHSLRNKVLERKLPFDVDDSNIFNCNEQLEDCHWDVHVFEFMSYIFCTVREELGNALLPKMLISRCLNKLDNVNDALIADAETHISYINEHLGVELPIMPIDLIGATKQYIGRQFARSTGIDDGELSL